MNLKIAFILDHGLKHYRLPLFELLEEKGYTVTVIYSGEQNLKTKINQVLVSEISLGPFKYKKLPKLSQFDVVFQMQNLHYLNTWFMVFNIFRRYKLIDWTIGTSTKRGLNKQIKFIDRCRNLLSIFSDGIILYTDFAFHKYSKRNRKKIFIANNTVYNPNPQNLSHLCKTGFLFVGTLNKRKGLDILLESFKQYLDNNKKVTIKYLYIIGKGEMYAWIRDFIRNNNLDENVILLGEINDLELKKRYFGKSIVNISPNQAGLSVLESFSFGVPFITRQNAISGGEHLNIIHGYNGYFFNKKNELLELLTSIDSNIERQIPIGTNAYNYYKNNRSFEMMVESFNDVIIYSLGK